MVGFFPKDDHNQTLRIKRFLMAFGSYVMWSTLIADKKETRCTWYKNIKKKVLLNGLLLFMLSFFNYNLDTLRLFYHGATRLV